MALPFQKLIIALLASLTALVGTGIKTPPTMSRSDLDNKKVLTALVSHINHASEVEATELLVELAQTPAARQQGLSGRAKLEPNQGMLFLFPDDSPQNFWMKDMNFPLDIIWLDKNGKIIGIADNVASSTFPNTIASPGPIRQVLEVSAGYAKKNQLTIGDFIHFSPPN